jgi:hypothetical protein
MQYQSTFSHEKSKRRVVCDDGIKILKPGEQEKLNTVNYLVPQLKKMCKYYNVGFVVGTKKNELIHRLFSFLKQSYYAEKIQTSFRSFMLKKYIRAKGPAFIKRNACINETDFFTMERISDVEIEQFISFTDTDSMIYGFDMMSLYQMMSRTACPTKNPYNRNDFPKDLITNMNFLFKFSHIFFKKVVVTIDEPVVDNNKLLEMKYVSLFQEINNLGNYADHLWLWSLNKHNLIKFINCLMDIWAYRANLSNEMKRLICPPHGDPRVGISLQTIHNIDLVKLRKSVLFIAQNLILSATDESNRILGANYVLCALTLVNNDAALSMPWLYQSVSQH